MSGARMTRRTTLEAASASEPRPDLDPARLRQFAEALRRHEGQRIGRDALWAAFHAAFPNRPAGPEERRWLNAAIDHAEALGVVRRPALTGPRWDRAVRPVIPTSLDRVREAQAPRDDAWRREPWHPALAWVRDLKHVSDSALAFLRRVQAGLARGEFATPAPTKYRSLALTGDEKRLAKLADTSLFGPGRLSLAMLGCLPESLPIAWAPVSARPTAIIFENAGPFHVALEVLRELSASPYGIVAYGAGTQVSQSAGWLATIGRPLEAIHYVGDLDRPGLDFARAAGRAAEAAGLPMVEPAPGLHAAMLRAAAAFGHAEGWPYEPARADAGDADRLGFLPQAERRAVARMLAHGHRIPEEVLGPVELRTAFATGASDPKRLPA